MHESTTEVPLLSRNSSPQTTEPAEPHSCSSLQDTRLRRDEKPVFVLITTTCYFTYEGSAFLLLHHFQGINTNCKHPQVNHLTSQQSSSASAIIMTAAQSTPSILICTDDTQPSLFWPGSWWFWSLQVFLCPLSMEEATQMACFLHQSPLLSKDDNQLHLPLAASTHIVGTPMPIWWPCKHKESCQPDNAWVYTA